MAHNEPPHLDLHCLTPVLLILSMTLLRGTLLKILQMNIVIYLYGSFRVDKICGVFQVPCGHEHVHITNHLTLKVPITTAADDIHKYFFIVFQRK